MRQAAVSLQFVCVGVRAGIGGVPYDPSGDVVEMAFTLRGSDPVDGDWNAAEWDTSGAATSGTYNACCLVGPAGTIELQKMTYDVWVRITDDPEIPAIKSGETLTIF